MKKRFGAGLVALLASALAIAAGSTGANLAQAPAAAGRLHTTHATLACSDCHGDKAHNATVMSARRSGKACQSCHANDRSPARITTGTPGKHPRFAPTDDCKTCHKSP